MSWKPSKQFRLSLINRDATGKGVKLLPLWSIGYFSHTAVHHYLLTWSFTMHSYPCFFLSFCILHHVSEAVAAGIKPTSSSEAFSTLYCTVTFAKAAAAVGIEPATSSYTFSTCYHSLALALSLLYSSGLRARASPLSSPVWQRDNLTCGIAWTASPLK